MCIECLFVWVDEEKRNEKHRQDLIIDFSLYSPDSRYPDNRYFISITSSITMTMVFRISRISPIQLVPPRTSRTPLAYSLRLSRSIQYNYNYYRQYASTTQTKSLYSILGVKPSASKKDIKASFYKLSMEYHPDKNPDNESAHIRFIEINNAYSILSNDRKRRDYDLSQRHHTSTSNSSNSSPYQDQPFTYGTGHRRNRTSHWSSNARKFQQDPHFYDYYHHKPNQHSPPHQTKSSGQKFDFAEHYEQHYGEEARRQKMNAQRAQQRAAQSTAEPGKDEKTMATEQKRLWWAWGTFITVLTVVFMSEGIKLDELEERDGDWREKIIWKNKRKIIEVRQAASGDDEEDNINSNNTISTCDRI